MTFRFGWVLALAALAACHDGGEDADLDRLHDEAIAANAAAIAAAAPTTGAEGFELAVAGQVKKPVATLTWPELQQRATTHLKTINAQDPSAPDKLVDFRGVLLSDLIDYADPLPAATEVTLLGRDGFHATVAIADARKWHMLLAVAADDKPIAQSLGGPIYFVHPYSEAPEEHARYPDRFWAFYVVAMIVGTDPIKLRVGGARFDRAALESMPTATFDGQVGWKVDWPADSVQLRGVKLADVLAAAKIDLPPGGRVIVRGKAPVTHDPKEPVAIAIDDLERCQPMLALRWGPDDVRIPARLGGPVALVMPPACADRYGARYWMSFVTELLVESK